VVNPSAIELYHIWALHSESCCRQEAFCIYSVGDVQKEARRTGANPDYV